MKKTIFVLVFISIFINSGIFAQGGIMLSGKLGADASNFYGNNIDNSKAVFGFTGGLNAQFINETHFALMFETSYVPIEVRIKNGINNYKLKNKYIQCSLKPRYYINKMSSWYPMLVYYVDAGIYASYLFSSHASGELNGQKYDKVNMINDYEKQDYGISFGGGVTVFKRFYIQLNYNLGITEVSKITNIKNNSLDITFMFYILDAKRYKNSGTFDVNYIWHK